MILFAWLFLKPPRPTLQSLPCRVQVVKLLTLVLGSCLILASAAVLEAHFSSRVLRNQSFLSFLYPPGPDPINKTPALIILDFATLKFWTNQRGLKSSADCSDWLTFQRSINNAEKSFVGLEPGSNHRS